MAGGIADDWWDSIPNPARWLIVGALLTSTGSGVINFNKPTDDRFRGADFRREISTRDAQIIDNKIAISDLKAEQVQHGRHSATYTQIIIELRKDFEDHIRREHK